MNTKLKCNYNVIQRMIERDDNNDNGCIAGVLLWEDGRLHAFKCLLAKGSNWVWEEGNLIMLPHWTM